MTSVNLVNIEKSFHNLRILKGINLKIESGAFVVLLGPSGCGKSTLLSLVAGLDTVTSGDIEIGGQVATGVHPRDRDVAMVFQSYALYPSMTVRRNITFALEMRGVPKKQRSEAAEKAAALLRIEHLLDRKPSQLSGGQRQRVAMGRALVRQPKVFLFDEPLSNLDAQLRAEMRTEIKRLHARLGITTIYVTHDQIEAMTMATHIAVMNEGKVVQFGSPADIYERPASQFVARFVGSSAMNFIPAELDTTEPTPAIALSLQDKVRQIDLPAGLREKTQKSRRPVVVGIRPEAFRVGEPHSSHDVVVDVNVELIEPTGPDMLVFFKLGATSLTARLGPKDLRGPGPAQLIFNAADVHLFDPEDGGRVEFERSAADQALTLNSLLA